MPGEDDTVNLDSPIGPEEITSEMDDLLEGSETSDAADERSPSPHNETELAISNKRKLDDGKEVNCAKILKSTDEPGLPEPAAVVAGEETRKGIKLRGYQWEISEKVLKDENDIIIMPTGTGKTAVAANLVLHHLRKHQNREEKVKVLFLVPRVVLVDQQLEAIQQYVGDVLKNKCRRMTGEDLDSMDTLKNLLTEQEYSVIVATPQIILNYFYAFECSTMRDFTLIIFDECHNARGNDPYNKLLELYMKERADNPDQASTLPQLVGMTATVGIGGAKTGGEAKEYIMDVCAKLGLTTLPADIISCKDQLEGVMDEPMASNELVETERDDPFSKYLREVMKQIICDIETKLKSSPAWRGIKNKFRPAKNLLNQSLTQTIKEAISGLTAAARPEQPDAIECIKHLEHLKVYHQALQWANLARLQNSMEYIEEEMEKNHLRNCEFFKKYRETYATDLRQLASDEDKNYPNKKLLALKQELDKVLEQERIDDNYKPRIMVFVEHRRLASMINEWLCSLGKKDKKYKSGRFVSSLQSSAAHGMTVSEAKEVTAQFKEGELNILVATSVLSEGYDIPECNCVIRYMYIKDVVAEVQVPGRVRSKNGTIVAIFDQKLKKQYEETKIMEARMDHALKAIRGMTGQDFSEQMRQRRSDRCRQIQREIPGRKSPSDVQVLCKQCKRKVGQLEDVYRYMAVHYIATNLNRAENVNFVLDQTGDTHDAMTECGTVTCKDLACGCVLGDIFRIKLKDGVGWKVIKWKASQVTLSESGGSFLNVKKWPEIRDKFAIPDIKQEELNKLAQDGKPMEID